MAFTKTQGTSVLSTQEVAANSQLISSVQTLATEEQATLFFHFGKNSKQSGGPVKIRIEASPKSSNNGFWVPIHYYTTNGGSSISTSVEGTVGSGTAVITCGSTDGFNVGDYIMIRNSTVANSEWGRIKSIVANTSITIEDNLLNAQTGSVIFSNAECYAIPVDMKSLARIRVVADGMKSSQGFVIESQLISAV